MVIKKKKYYMVSEDAFEDLRGWSRPLECCRAYDCEAEYDTSFEIAMKHEIPLWLVKIIKRLIK
jgi:hypothetical protein